MPTDLDRVRAVRDAAAALLRVVFSSDEVRLLCRALGTGDIKPDLMERINAVSPAADDLRVKIAALDKWIAENGGNGG